MSLCWTVILTWITTAQFSLSLVRLTAVEEAAFRSIAKAAELIDLDHHTGEHPRIGATDVVPFVPISGADDARMQSKLRAISGSALETD